VGLHVSLLIGEISRIFVWNIRTMYMLLILILNESEFAQSKQK